MRSSGWNGLPCWIPTEANMPRVSGSADSGGSDCTTSLSRSQNWSSAGGTAHIGSAETFTNRIGGGSSASASG